MSYFLYKLIAPRPTFAQDMTEAEAKLLAEHGIYWRELADRGIALLFGPVLDPKGSWGLAVVDAKTEAEVRDIGRNDPAITSNRGFGFEIYPMPQVTLRK
jgi:uncharacterized protein